MERENKKRDFPTRKDLYYWIIILVLFIVGIFTFYYASDGDVISHIGLGGTIISILLAVIAIIYSFYQSSTYENATDKLDNSAKKIEDATKQLSNVSEIKGILDEFIKEVDDIKSSISELRTTVSTIDSHVSNMSRTWEETRGSLSSMFDKTKQNNSISGLYSKEQVQGIIDNGSNMILLTLFIIEKGFSLKREEVNLQDYIGFLYQNDIMPSSLNEETIEYSMIGILSVFNAVNITDVTFIEDSVKIEDINQYLSEAIESKLLYIEESDSDLYNTLHQIQKSLEENKA